MTDGGQTSDLARAVQDVTEKAQLVIREEIELAKAEVGEKAKKIARGAAVGAAAGVFVGGSLVMVMHTLAWLAYRLIFPDGGLNYWVGFLVVALLLLLVAVLAGLLAFRWLKGGTPPTPQMAIEEAQLIRETVTGHHPERRG